MSRRRTAKGHCLCRLTAAFFHVCHSVIAPSVIAVDSYCQGSVDCRDHVSGDPEQHGPSFFRFILGSTDYWLVQASLLDLRDRLCNMHIGLDEETHQVVAPPKPMI